MVGLQNNTGQYANEIKHNQVLQYPTAVVIMNFRSNNSLNILHSQEYSQNKKQRNANGIKVGCNSATLEGMGGWEREGQE